MPSRDWWEQYKGEEDYDPYPLRMPNAPMRRAMGPYPTSSPNALTGGYVNYRPPGTMANGEVNALTGGIVNDFPLGGPPVNPLLEMYNQFDALIPQFAPPSSGTIMTSAYDKAIAGIQGRYQKALEDIHGRESKAQEVLGQMPQDIMNIYTQGEGSAQEGVNRAFDTAQTLPEGYALPQDIQKAGFNEGEISAPFDAAIQGMQSDRLADVKYLGLGTGQFFGGMRDQLNAEMASRLADVEMKRSEYLQSQEDNNNALNLERAKLIFSMMAPQLEADEEGTGPVSWQDRFGSKSEAEEYYGSNQAGRAEVSYAHGQYIADHHPDYIKKWRDQYGMDKVGAFYTDVGTLGPYAAAQKHFADNPGYASVLLYQFGLGSAG